MIVIIDTGQLTGQQVRGKLDSGKCQIHASRHGLGKHGFPGSGHILQKDVAVGQEGCQKQVDGIFAAYDDFGYILFDTLDSLIDHGRLLLQVIGKNVKVDISDKYFITAGRVCVKIFCAFCRGVNNNTGST